MCKCSIKSTQYVTGDGITHPRPLQSPSQAYSCEALSQIIHACTNPFWRAHPFTFSYTLLAELSWSKPTRFLFHRWECAGPPRVWLSITVGAEDARGNDFDPVQPTAYVAGNGAKAVISIGRPYKFAGGVPASVKRAQVLRRYIAVPLCRGHVLITMNWNTDSEIMISPVHWWQ